MTSFYGEFRKKNIISDEEENQKSRANVDKWIFRLLLLLIGFMPIIVLANIQEVVSPVVSNFSMLTSGTKGDLFTRYKSLLIIAVTIVLVFLLLAKVFFMNAKINKSKLNYILGGFALTIIISTILSPNISIALNGQYNRSEGAITWLCYITILFIAMNIKYPKNANNFVMYSLYPFILINFLIITMNFYGKDLLQYYWIQRIISLFLTEGTNISEGSLLIGTLNQWNYMSGMFSIMTIMILTWSILDRKIVRSVINLIVSLISMTIMLMATSASGFVTIVCMIPILIWLIFKSSNKKKSIPIILIFLLITTLLIHFLSMKNSEVWDESVGFFIFQNPYTVQEEVATTSGNKLNINSNFFDIPSVYAAGKSFDLPTLPDANWGAGTGRIYIWEKTVNLTLERPIFGYGLDTLLYHFPHTDIEARGNLNEITIVDKPHNMYVGILFGTGIVGLLFFISFILLSLNKALKEIICFNSKSSYIITFCLAWIAFLIQAIFNDSSPGVSGSLFAIGGIMLGLLNENNKVKHAN